MLNKLEKLANKNIRPHPNINSHSRYYDIRSTRSFTDPHNHSPFNTKEQINKSMQVCLAGAVMCRYEMQSSRVRKYGCSGPPYMTGRYTHPAGGLNAMLRTCGQDLRVNPNG